MSGSAVKNHGRQLHANRTISYLLSFHGYPPILEAIRPLHRHHRTRQVHLQIQYWSEVTKWLHASGADQPKNPKTNIKRWMTVEIRTTVCEIVLSGWRSSKKIWWTQICLHPNTVLRTQIRNVLRKWDQNQGNIEFSNFPKDRNCEVCLRTKMTRTLCRRRIGEAVLRAENFGDLITADHKVLNEGCESRDNHQYAVVVQDLAPQWIQSYPCKTKISQETEKEFTRVSRAVGKAESHFC